MDLETGEEFIVLSVNRNHFILFYHLSPSQVYGPISASIEVVYGMLGWKMSTYHFHPHRACWYG